MHIGNSTGPTPTAFDLCTATPLEAIQGDFDQFIPEGFNHAVGRTTTLQHSWPRFG